MLFQLVYVSTSNMPVQPGVLEELMLISRQRNDEIGITGLLVHSGGQFVQLLEGERDAVEALYAVIADDPRHIDVRTIGARESETRLFPDWSMGLIDISEYVYPGDEELQHMLSEPFVREMATDDGRGERIFGDLAMIYSRLSTVQVAQIGGTNGRIARSA